MKHLADVSAYPLCWPEGWPRTPAHARKDGARFKGGQTYEGYGDNKRYVGRRLISFDRARKLLREELGRLGAKMVTVSTDVELRNDGEPRAGSADKRSIDPGIAVYFQYKGKPMVMAQDAFDTLAANTRSLGLAIDALRSLERHGGGTMMERAFTGFSALPPPDGAKPKRPWWQVLNYSGDSDTWADLSADEIEARYRTLAKRRHPDVEGGSIEAFQELGDAKEEALRAVS